MGAGLQDQTSVIPHCMTKSNGLAAGNLWSLSEGNGKDNLEPSLLKTPQCWCYNTELIQAKAVAYKFSILPSLFYQVFLPSLFPSVWCHLIFSFRWGNLLYKNTTLLSRSVLWPMAFLVSI